MYVFWANVVESKSEYQLWQFYTSDINSSNSNYIICSCSLTLQYFSCHSTVHIRTSLHWGLLSVNYILEDSISISTYNWHNQQVTTAYLKFTWLPTVYLQIFEACKFQGRHKFSIFAIIFLRITEYPAFQLMQAKVLSMKFQGWKFRRWLTAKTSKITYIPRKFVHIRYIDTAYT